MIRISPEELHFAVALAAIRQRPSSSDGPKCRLRHHFLSYHEDSGLTFQTGDQRVCMVSQLCVKGKDTPWECRVGIRNFDIWAKLAAGGRYSFNSGLPGRIQVEKKHKQPGDDRIFTLKYPLFHIPDLPPQPVPNWPVAETERTTIPISAFFEAVAFLVPDGEKRNVGSRLDTCCITTEGEAIGWAQDVFLRKKTIRLGLEFNVHASDAGRLQKWLKLLSNQGASEIRIALVEDQHGRDHYLVQTADGRHSFLMLKATRTPPRDIIDRATAEPELIRGVVSSDALSELAEYFRQFQNCPLVFHFVPQPDGEWALNVTTFGEAPDGGGCLPLRDCNSNDCATSIPAILVSPDHLITSFRRHKAMQLTISFHPNSHALILSSPLTQAGLDGAAIQQTFLRVRRVPSATINEVGPTDPS